MRSVVWLLTTAAAVALAGCDHSSNSPSSVTVDDTQANVSAPAAHSITGTIALRGGAIPSSQSKLSISIVNVTTQGAAPLATKEIASATIFPQTFELNFTPANVAPRDLYIVQAQLTDGDRRYAMPLQVPVLTKGNPTTHISIELVPKQTPGEKLLAAFQHVQKQIGGMKRSAGTKLEQNASRAWQVFREDGEVKFIRELVDYGDKGFANTDFAYKDGKPWVVQQQKQPNKNAKPVTVDFAGWADDGVLVLKTHQAGGNTSPLSDSDAQNLQQQARDILNIATGSKGK